MSDHSFATIFRELIVAFNEVVKGEIRLAKAEVRGTTAILRKDLFRLITFSALAVAGLLPLMAFLVIGLGRLLGDNYLWSSLIVGVLLVTIGASVSYHAFRKTTQLDYALPHTVQSIEERLELLNQKLNELTQATAPTHIQSKRSAA